MKAETILASIRELEPSSFDTRRLLGWLSELDGQLWEQVIRTHADAPTTAFTGHESADSELLVPWPYGQGLYENYLKARIAAENAETERYNQCAALYTAALNEWRNAYHRAHRPLGAKSMRI